MMNKIGIKILFKILFLKLKLKKILKDHNLLKLLKMEMLVMSSRES